MCLVCFPDLSRRNLSILARQCKHLVSRGLNRPGLMDIDMAGYCRKRSLIWAQDCADHSKIRLRSAYQEVHVSLRRIAQFPNLLPGTLTVWIVAIPYRLFIICLFHLL